jgi:hypothetical protein
VLFDVGEGPLRAIQNACGIRGSVLEPGSQELAFA